MQPHNQQQLFLKVKSETRQQAHKYTHQIMIIFLLGWLCGGWGGGSSLDFIFSRGVYWLQNDKDAFPKPIMALQRCCYHVTLTALKEDDARP